MVASSRSELLIVDNAMRETMTMKSGAVAASLLAGALPMVLHAVPNFDGGEDSLELIAEHIAKSAQTRGQANATAARYRNYARKLAKTLAQLDAQSQSRIFGAR